MTMIMIAAGLLMGLVGYMAYVLLKRNFWIVSTVAYLLLVAFSLAFGECYDKVGCFADPCKGLWRQCTLAAINQPYFVALSTIGLGGVIAWWYQRANKVMEFRFSTFEKAMNVYTHLSNAAWDHFKQHVLIQKSQLRGVNAENVHAMQRELGHLEKELHANILAAHTILAGNFVLFSVSTSNHWGAMIQHYQEVTGDNLWAIEEHLFSAAEARLSYIHGVARTIRLPFPKPAREMEEEIARHRAELQADLVGVQRKPEPPPGGIKVQTGGNNG